eukprot:2758728-Lingulodinium_polyedra.AAC.1
MLSSLAVGLDELVAVTRADRTAADYHLHGWARLQRPHREFLILGALVSFVPDSFLLEVLEDDR